MRISGSQGTDKPVRVSNASHTKVNAEKNPHSKLTRNLTKTFNSFLGILPNTPLTIQTLDQVQAKFWPSPNEELMTNIWNICKDTSREFLAAQEDKAIRSTNSGTKKRPIAFSTTDGLDIVLQLEEKDGQLQVQSILVNPGGSAVNVARALSNFGTPFELIGTVGSGPKGKMYSEALVKEGIDPNILIPLNMDHRIHFSTAINSKEYWLVSALPIFNGPQLSDFTGKVIDACRKNEKEAFALSNREPAGAKETYVPETIKTVQDKYGMFVIYDTKKHAVSKEVVDSVLNIGPGMIKPNLVEFGDIVGSDESTLRNDKDLIAQLAQELIKQHGINLILVSMDKDGAMLIDKKRAAHANAPKIVVASPGCAGDTGIGAMIDRSKKRDFSLKGLSDKQFKDILSAFTAAGAATASKPGSLIATLEEVEALEKQVKAKFV